jgi:hypothetical protein
MFDLPKRFLKPPSDNDESARMCLTCSIEKTLQTGWHKRIIRLMVMTRKRISRLIAHGRRAGQGHPAEEAKKRLGL